MEPNNKNTLKLVVVGVVVILVGVLAFTKGWLKKDGANSGNSGTVSENTSETFSPDVPKDIELTKPALENPIDPSSKSESKIRTFEISASKSGFSPSELVVNLGDQIGVAVTAVDGDYDFELPDLGSYQVIKEGERKWATNFIAFRSGTFTFVCRDYCPSGQKISGKLIVRE